MTKAVLYMVSELMACCVREARAVRDEQRERNCQMNRYTGYSHSPPPCPSCPCPPPLCRAYTEGENDGGEDSQRQRGDGHAAGGAGLEGEGGGQGGQGAQQRQWPGQRLLRGQRAEEQHKGCGAAQLLHHHARCRQRRRKRQVPAMVLRGEARVRLREGVRLGWREVWKGSCCAQPLRRRPLRKSAASVWLSGYGYVAEQEGPQQARREERTVGWRSVWLATTAQAPVPTGCRGRRRAHLADIEDLAPGRGRRRGGSHRPGRGGRGGEL